MKQFLFIILAVLAMSADAGKLKILFVNTKTINIGGKTLKRGSVFDEKDVIAWDSPNQAMKVEVLATKKVIVMTAKKIKKEKTIADYYLKSNKLSTRSANCQEYVLYEDENFDTALNDTCYLLDSISYVSWIPTDADNYFYLKYKIQDCEYVKKINGNNLQLQLDDIFPGRDSLKNMPKQLTVEVWYHSSTPHKEVFQEHWNIEFIDKELSE